MINIFKRRQDNGNESSWVLERLQSRDTALQNEAVKYVIKHYQRDLKSFLYSKGCWDEKVREEIFFEALEKIVDPATTLRHDSANIRTIINAFAFNKWRTYLRSRSLTTEIPESWLRFGTETDEASLIEILGANGSAFDNGALEEEQEDVLIVRRALKMMTGKHCHQIFDLKYYHLLTQAEIAEELNLARGTVNSLMNGKCIEELEKILRSLGLRGMGKGMPKIEVQLKDIGKGSKPLAAGDGQADEKQEN